MRLHDYDASGNCFKVRLLIGMLGLPVERVPVDIFAGDTLTDAFRRLNLTRETPVLELDDGTTIAQSNAILWYLAEGTSFLPDERVGRAQAAQWLAFEQEWIMRNVAGARFRLLTGRPGGRERLPSAERAIELLAERLDGREWVAADAPTIADLSIYAYAHTLADLGLDAPPPVAAWLARVEALPGFVNDLASYPDNALPGHGRSIYD